MESRETKKTLFSRNDIKTFEEDSANIIEKFLGFSLLLPSRGRLKTKRM